MSKPRLDRLFAKALAGDDSRRPAMFRPLPPPAEVEEAFAPTSQGDAERLLAAFKKSDYAACLGVPAVVLDETGRAVWAVTDSQLSRAFRKASLGVHPDKNPAPAARAAFDALSEAQRRLQDASLRAAYVREAGERLMAALRKEAPEEARRMEKAAEAAAAAGYAEEVRTQAARAADKARQRREQQARRAAEEAAAAAEEEEEEAPLVSKRAAGEEEEEGCAVVRPAKRGRGPKGWF